MSSASSEVTPESSPGPTRPADAAGEPAAASPGVAGASVEGFLAALASGSPSPGGGAAAALAGALAAALVAMVARVTVAREPARATAGVAQRADRARAHLTALADEDTRAYPAVIVARRRPPAERDAAVAEALRAATGVPVSVAGECSDVLALCEQIAPSARATALADLRVAAILAAGAIDAACVTARDNLAGLADRAFAASCAERLTALAADGHALAARVAAAVAARAA